jgi:hypothetical protein
MHHLRTDVGVLRQHVGGLVQSDLGRDDRFATIDARIERRLDLRDADA